MKKEENCDICYKIICKRCGWEADEQEVVQIQCEELTACPLCGWKPTDEVSNKEKRKKINKFLQEHQLAVVSTYNNAHKTPESALIAYVEDDKFCLFFQTGKYTRKATNVKQSSSISMVIGLTLDDMATLQYEGKAELLEDAGAIKECKKRFLAKNSPTTAEYLERPAAIFYKVTPTWISFSDYTEGEHPSVIVLEEFV